MRKGGLLFLAPPCGLWVFLTLGWSSAGVSVQKNIFHMHQLLHSKLKLKHHVLNFDLLPRSQGTTKKSWWDPEGDTSYRGVLRSNIFVMRMLYLTLGRTIVQWLVHATVIWFWTVATWEFKDILCSLSRNILCDWTADDLSQGLLFFDVMSL